MKAFKSFSGFKLRHGLVHENFVESSFPSNLYGFAQDQEFEFLNEDSTYYGFVYEGRTTLYYHDLEIPLTEGMYFCIPGGASKLVGGRGVIIEKLDYNGVFSVGGPVEEKGRLKYIDGCTDSLLVAPVKKGDACLNALFFPPGIDQTQHTHPSDRVGLIYKGTGKCITPDEEIDLNEGDLFVIHENGLHSFRTDLTEELVVIAFHPDSDFGPEDENHPMINRTLVEGLSASIIEKIRTK